jgi:hypothetical protein
MENSTSNTVYDYQAFPCFRKIDYKAKYKDSKTRYRKQILVLYNRKNLFINKRLFHIQGQIM